MRSASKTSISKVETLIVGGGLSGLCLARMLHNEGRLFTLIEARNRLGGRIAGHMVDSAVFDLGPAWFWPGQPRIATLIEALDLAPFEQFSTGAAVYEDEQGRRQTAHGFASMAGSYRLAGGFNALIDAIASELPSECVVRDHSVAEINQLALGIEVVTSEQTFIADRVVLAVPPRVVAQAIRFEPALPVDAMNGISTWMAGHAKAVAIYDTPFWREAGLSGDAVSRMGPMMEIHDASPASAGPFALFGFLGTPVSERGDEQALRGAIADQLGRLFGPQAATPKELVLKDWAFDPRTATPLDHPPLFSHPKYGLPEELSNLFEGRLILASTETAPEFGGYLEGALEAAEIAFARLTRPL